MHPVLLSFLSPGDSEPLPRRNTAPVVLIGGCTNWGRDELFGFRYWGGPGRDIQEDLRQHDFETHTAGVGPFSSNWDRACEAYAILKGGRVDYGKVHAAKHGHERFGRNFPGLLKTWDESRKVHLVTHSQGGQTARVLAQLLTQGDAAEREGTPLEELNPLFAGSHRWVFSVTSLSTPHDGTSLVYRREGIIGPVRKLLTLGTSISTNHNSSVYDVKLDQWSLQRTKGESLRAFSSRLFEAPLWKGTQDFSAWDLSPEGARELNAWVKAQPDIYYFSWSTAKTTPDEKGSHIPSPRMTPIWRQGARFMGSTTRAGAIPIDASWWENDGVVNTRSMAGPSTDTVQSFSGKPRPGIWNHMGILEGWDHSEILGIGREHGREVLDFYRRWAAFLGSLKAD